MCTALRTGNLTVMARNAASARIHSHSPVVSMPAEPVWDQRRGDKVSVHVINIKFAFPAFSITEWRKTELSETSVSIPASAGDQGLSYQRSRGRQWWPVIKARQRVRAHGDARMAAISGCWPQHATTSIAWYST